MTNLANSNYILQNFQDDTRFPALAYAKQSGCEEYTECKNSLLASLNIISGMNIRSNPNHKSCIFWARRAKKNVDQVLNNAVVKQYFYMKTRENYLATKQYINERFKNSNATRLIDTMEDGSIESATSSSAITTSTSANRATATDINIAAKSINTGTLKTGIEEHNLKFEEHFEKFDSSKKWYLSTGKCVDDELFLFGLQCNYDHPARSFIMDPDDKNFLSYNVFTHAELKEIVEYKE